MEIKRLVGEKVKALRQAQGLTQEQLAERAGLSTKFISEIERGLVNIGIESLMSIAAGLQVNPGDLLQEGITDKLLKEIALSDINEAMLQLSALNNSLSRISQDIKSTMNTLNKIASKYRDFS